MPHMLELCPPSGYASWSRRVIAVLLDTAILGAIAFLANGPFEASLSVPTASINTSTIEPSAPAASFVGLLALWILQGRTGATPGKRAVGIVVVSDSTLQPIGVARTALRWLAHLLDAIVMLGYLRPLWHRERRTFTDSLCATVSILDPHPRRRPVTIAAIAVCAIAILFCVPVNRSVGTGYAMSCETTGVGRDQSTYSATLTYLQSTQTQWRLGIPRTWETVGPALIEWSDPRVITDSAVFSLTLFAEDGAQGDTHSSIDVSGGSSLMAPASDLHQVGPGGFWTAQWWDSTGLIAECTASERVAS